MRQTQGGREGMKEEERREGVWRRKVMGRHTLALVRAATYEQQTLDALFPSTPAGGEVLCCRAEGGPGR